MNLYSKNFIIIKIVWNKYGFTKKVMFFLLNLLNKSLVYINN